MKDTWVVFSHSHTCRYTQPPTQACIKITTHIQIKKWWVALENGLWPCGQKRHRDHDKFLFFLSNVGFMNKLKKKKKTDRLYRSEIWNLLEGRVNFHRAKGGYIRPNWSGLDAQGSEEREKQRLKKVLSRLPRKDHSTENSRDSLLNQRWIGFSILSLGNVCFKL